MITSKMNNTRIKTKLVLKPVLQHGLLVTVGQPH